MATLSYDDFPRSAAEERELRKSLGKSATNWPAPIVDASQIKQEINQIGYPGGGWDSNNGEGSSDRNKKEALIEMKGNAGIPDNAGFKGLLNDKVGLPIAAGALATVFTGDSNKSKLTNAVLAAGGAAILQQMLGSKGQGQETPSTKLEEQNADQSSLGVGPGSDQDSNNSDIFYQFPLGDNITDPKENQASNISGAFSEDATFSQASNTSPGETTELNTFTPSNEQGVMNAHIINPGTSDSEANTLNAQSKTKSLLDEFKNIRIPNALASGAITV